MSLVFSAPHMPSGTIVNDQGMFCDISQGSHLFLRPLELIPLEGGDALTAHVDHPTDTPESLKGLWLELC